MQYAWDRTALQGLKPFPWLLERAKAEALAYLEATATAEADPYGMTTRNAGKNNCKGTRQTAEADSQFGFAQGWLFGDDKQEKQQQRDSKSKDKGFWDGG